MLKQGSGSGLFATEEDAEGYIFIDRDPTHFSSVLTYLREGSLVARYLADESTKGPLCKELRYYGLRETTKPLHIYASTHI
jgi:hypothetical protein